jgi:acetylornithine deacetylase/succinyl-diaminopimelate desuccinylase-like protein
MRYAKIFTKKQPSPSRSSLDKDALKLRYSKEALKDLLNINTTMSDNNEHARDTREGTEYAAKYFAEKCGAEIIRGPDYEFPEGSGCMHTNILAVWRPKSGLGKGEKPVVFSSHIDTVPAPGVWPSGDPFTAVEQDDKIIGRGACDLKGAMASFMGDMRARYEAGELEHLTRPIVYGLSSGEEIGLLGTPHIIKLLKDHKLDPDEIVVMEPTEGYIGIGSKGGLQDTLTLHANQETRPQDPETQAKYTHYCTIELSSAGGHSSLQGGTAADPALAASTVLTYVQQLRDAGIQAEVTGIRYGEAGNTVGGKLALTVGYAPRAEDGFEAIQGIPEALNHALGGQAMEGNLRLAAKQNLINFVQICKQQVHGLDLGQLAVTTTQFSVIEPNDAGELAIKEGHEAKPITVTHENGKLVCHNAAEKALAMVGKIYEINARQKEGGIPPENVLGPLGQTKLSNSMINGNQQETTIRYDIRYPLEAAREEDQQPGRAAYTGKPIEKMVDLRAEILEKATELDAAVTRTDLMDFAPSYIVSKDDPRRKDYETLAKSCGFSQFKTSSTVVPYGCDGNILSRAFPDAMVVTAGAGGFGNMLHGIGEHITTRQINLNQRLYGGIMEMRAGLPPASKSYGMVA